MSEMILLKELIQILLLDHCKKFWGLSNWQCCKNSSNAMFVPLPISFTNINVFMCYFSLGNELIYEWLLCPWMVIKKFWFFAFEAKGNEKFRVWLANILSVLVHDHVHFFYFEIWWWRKILSLFFFLINPLNDKKCNNWHIKCKWG
jgi:hypothetical protein